MMNTDKITRLYTRRLCKRMVIFKRFFIKRRLRMIDFFMKLRGVWAILLVAYLSSYHEKAIKALYELA